MDVRPKCTFMELQSETEALAALRRLKARVIGNPRAKEDCVRSGAVPGLVAMLAADQPPALQEQAAIVLGSLAHGSVDAFKWLEIV